MRTTAHQFSRAVCAARNADRVLPSTTGTALTRVAGDGRIQPCRGGRVHNHSRLTGRAIRATDRPGFRTVPALGAGGKLPVGRSNR